jgi:hypothetical protein
MRGILCAVFAKNLLTFVYHGRGRVCDQWDAPVFQLGRTLVPATARIKYLVLVNPAGLDSTGVLLGNPIPQSRNRRFLGSSPKRLGAYLPERKPRFP